MKLHVKRSSATKGKLLGGSDTFYVLHLRVEVPPDDLAFLARYRESHFSKSDELIAMQVEKKIEGPEYLSVEARTRGVEFTGKSVHKVLARLQAQIVEEYQVMFGPIQARENWPGEQTLSVSLN